MTVYDVLEGHREATVERCPHAGVVLMVQDTTMLNYDKVVDHRTEAFLLVKGLDGSEPERCLLLEVLGFAVSAFLGMDRWIAVMGFIVEDEDLLGAAMRGENAVDHLLEAFQPAGIGARRTQEFLGRPGGSVLLAADCELVALLEGLEVAYAHMHA